MKGGFYTHHQQMAEIMWSTLIMSANKKCNLPFGLLASSIKMTILLLAPPANKLKPATPPESSHLGPTTFFARNHNGVGRTTRIRRIHACRSKQSLCPMPSALHTE